MIIFSFCTFIWILTRNSSNIASIIFKFTKSCRMSRIRLKILITRLIDFWTFVSIAQSWKNQRSLWSSSLSFWIRFLTKFIETRNEKLKTSLSSLLKCALFAKKNIIQRTIIINNLISNEIMINSTKNEIIKTANANKITMTTNDLIRKSMTKKKSTKFTSSSILKFWRSWTLCFVKSCIKFWTRFIFNTMYKINRRSFFTRRSRNLCLSTI